MKICSIKDSNFKFWLSQKRKRDNKDLSKRKNWPFDELFSLCFNEAERRFSMNTVVLIGRLTSEPVLTETKENKERTVIQLAVPRTFKNVDGIYETDFFRCILWNGIAKRAKEYCKKGDMVCVKGRLQVREYEENEERKFITEVIAESISFVSSANRKEKST